MTSDFPGGPARGMATRRSLLALGGAGLLAGAAATPAAAGAASATAANTPDWINVTAFGADRTGGADSTTAFASAIQAATSTIASNTPAGVGAVVYVPTGTYKISSTLACTTVPVYFVGDGPWASVISYTGTGPCFWIHDSSVYSSRTRWGGGFVGITVDGNGAAAGAAGLRVGDLLQYELDVTVRNFTGAGSIGVHLDNNYYWTEQLYGRIYAENCASHVVFDWTVATADTSSGSFERCDLDVFINQQNAAFDGVVFRNGAFTGNGSLKIRGNFSASPTAVRSAVLRLTGTNFQTVNGVTEYLSNSGIVDGMLDIGVECGSIPNGYSPQTIVFGSPANTISGCSGALNFGLAGDTFTASNNAGNIDGFIGHVTGDTTLPEDGWVEYTGGFPAGVTGHVALRRLPTGSEVMVTWALVIASGTTLQAGQTIVQVASRFAYTDNKIIPGNCTGGGLIGNVYVPAYLTAGGALQYAGPTRQSSGTTWWYGQGVYTLR